MVAVVLAVAAVAVAAATPEMAAAEVAPATDAPAAPIVEAAEMAMDCTTAVLQTMIWSEKNKKSEWLTK